MKSRVKWGKRTARYTYWLITHFIEKANKYCESVLYTSTCIIITKGNLIHKNITQIIDFMETPARHGTFSPSLSRWIRKIGGLSCCRRAQRVPLANAVLQRMRALRVAKGLHCTREGGAECESGRAGRTPRNPQMMSRDSVDMNERRGLRAALRESPSLPVRWEMAAVGTLPTARLQSDWRRAHCRPQKRLRGATRCPLGSRTHNCMRQWRPATGVPLEWTRRRRHWARVRRLAWSRIRRRAHFRSGE